jgi:hypothetical protein
MSRLIKLSLALAILGAFVLLASAGERPKSSTSDDHRYSIWLSHYDEDWNSMLRRAGQVRDGIVTEALVTPREAEIGQPVTLVVSSGNLYDWPSGQIQDEVVCRCVVLMRDASGRPMLPQYCPVNALEIVLSIAEVKSYNRK